MIVSKAERVAAASDTAQGQIAGPPAQPCLPHNEDPSASPPAVSGPPLVGWGWAIEWPPVQEGKREGGRRARLKSDIF